MAKETGKKSVFKKIVTITLCAILFAGILCAVLFGVSLLNADNSANALLRAITETAVRRVGIDAELHVTTIDVLAYSDYELDEFKQWVAETYNNPSHLVIVFETEAEKAEIFTGDHWQTLNMINMLRERGYDLSLNDNFDWTHIAIDYAQGVTWRQRVLVDVDFSYITLRAGEGWKLSMCRTLDGWEYEDAKQNWLS